MTTIKIRGGTAAQWASANPILAAREPGVETDTGVYKVGDGATAWSSLSPVLNGTYAKRRIGRIVQGIARAEALRNAGQVMTSPPTLTAGNFSGTNYVEASTPAISSGRVCTFTALNGSKVQPSSYSAAPASVLSLGCTPRIASLASQNSIYPLWQTGLSGVLSDTSRVAFRHHGQRVSMSLANGTGGTGYARFKVNGQYVSLDRSSIGAATTQAYALDFGSRTVTDGATTNASATLTSATAAFTISDVGNTVAGTGIPTGTTIVGYANATTVTMGANATATGSSLSVTIGNVADRLIEIEMQAGVGLARVSYDNNDTVYAPPVVPGPRILIVGDSYAQGTGSTFPGFTGLPQEMARELGCLDLWIDASGGTGYVATNSGSSFNYLTRQQTNWPIMQAAGGADLVVVFGSINDPAGGTQAQVQANATSLFSLYGSTPVVAVIAANSASAAATVAPTVASIQAAAAACSNVLGVLDLTSTTFTGGGTISGPTGSGNSDRFRYSDGSHPAQAGHTYYGTRIARYIASLLDVTIP